MRAELNYEWFSDTEETNESFLSTNEAMGDQPTEDVQMTPPDVTNAPVTMGMLAELLRSLNAGNSNRGIQRKEVIKLPEFNGDRSEWEAWKLLAQDKMRVDGHIWPMI